MKKILLIGTFFGKWPVWFPATYRSMAVNDTIDWLIFTDCEIPADIPANIRFVESTCSDINKRASEVLGFEVSKHVYAQCDLRPVFPLMFEEHIAAYDFWGHIDFDLVWGDLRAYFTDAMLDRYRIICTRKNRVSGHLTLWKKCQENSILFKKYDIWKSLLSDANHHAFDEIAMTDVIKQEKLESLVKWDERMVAGPAELGRRFGWCWDHGRILCGDDEYPYLHFANYWKSTVKRIDFGMDDAPEYFEIMRRGIWSGRVPLSERLRDVMRRMAQLIYKLIATKKTQKAI